MENPFQSSPFKNRVLYKMLKLLKALVPLTSRMGQGSSVSVALSVLTFSAAACEGGKFIILGADLWPVLQEGRVGNHSASALRICELEIH